MELGGEWNGYPTSAATFLFGESRYRIVKCIVGVVVVVVADLVPMVDVRHKRWLGPARLLGARRSNPSIHGKKELSLWLKSVVSPRCGRRCL